MGKASYSPLGQWRNKVGGQVYRIDAGEQIVSAYQPIVKNPRSEDQVENRTKFTSATRYIAGFKPFIDVMNPTGGRRALRATLMKKVMATMTGTSISQTLQNGNLVLIQTDKFAVTLNAATTSGDNFVFTGNVFLSAGVNAGDFVDEEVKVYMGVQQLNEQGSILVKELIDTTVTLSGTMEFSFTVSLDDLANGALVEVGGVGVLTADAWARFSRYNAIESNSSAGSTSVYSAANARIFTANVGRGVLR